jgi:hypothetical protein
MSFDRILKGAGHGRVLSFCRHYEATFHRTVKKIPGLSGGIKDLTGGLRYLSLILLSALASGLLLLLAWFLLPTAALLSTLTRLLFLLAGLLTTTTLLAALAWILISHDHVSPTGKFP